MRCTKVKIVKQGCKHANLYGEKNIIVGKKKKPPQSKERYKTEKMQTQFYTGSATPLCLRPVLKQPA